MPDPGDPTVCRKALLVEGGVQITGGNTSPGAGKVLTSDADGNATWQMTPSAKKIAFKLNEAFPSGANVFAAGPKYKVYFANEEYDYGNNVTPGDQSTNSVFTAPITGIYHFDAAIEWNVPGIETQIHLFKITTGGSEVVIRTVAVNETAPYNPGGVGAEPSSFVSADVRLLAGEKVIVKGSWWNGQVSGSSYTHAGPAGASPLGGIPFPMATSFNGHLVFAE